MAITRKFKVGESVYLRTDPEQFERVVVCIMDYGYFLQYMLNCGTECTQHFDYEISRDRNVLFNLN